MKGVVCRTVTQSDQAIVGEFVRTLLLELSGRTDFGDDSELVAEVLRSPACAGVLAESDERRPVGVIMLYEGCAIYAGGRFGVISELYVQPQYRSCGVAKLLLRSAIQIAQESGWTYLEVGAPRQPIWERSKKFYLREGFVEVGPRLKLSVSFPS